MRESRPNKITSAVAQAKIDKMNTTKVKTLHNQNKVRTTKNLYTEIVEGSFGVLRSMLQVRSVLCLRERPLHYTSGDGAACDVTADWGRV